MKTDTMKMNEMKLPKIEIIPCSDKEYARNAIKRLAKTNKLVADHEDTLIKLTKYFSNIII